MVKMKSGLDLEVQQVSRLNRYFLIANKIRKVGCSACQCNGKLRMKLLNLNGGNGALVPPPLICLGSSAVANGSVSPPMEDNRAFRFEVNIPPLEGLTNKDSTHGSKRTWRLLEDQQGDRCLAAFELKISKKGKRKEIF